jgi:hypothetical protein
MAFRMVLEPALAADGQPANRGPDAGPDGGKPSVRGRCWTSRNGTSLSFGNRPGRSAPPEEPASPPGPAFPRPTGLSSTQSSHRRVQDLQIFALAGGENLVTCNPAAI